MRREIRQHIPLEVFRQVVLSTQGVIFAKILVHNLEQIKQHIIRYGLTRSVCLIRQAVGDAGHQQHVIKTLCGYGYRFMADMTLPPAEVIRETTSERLSGDVLDEHVSEGSLAVASPPQEAAQPEGESTPEACDALVPSSGDAVTLPDIPPTTSVSPVLSTH